MFGRKKSSKRDLYYVFPVSGKALKKRYRRLILAGISVGLLAGGLMGLLIWLINR